MPLKDRITALAFGPVSLRQNQSTSVSVRFASVVCDFYLEFSGACFAQEVQSAHGPGAKKNNTRRD